MKETERAALERPEHPVGSALTAVEMDDEQIWALIKNIQFDWTGDWKALVKFVREVIAATPKAAPAAVSEPSKFEAWGVHDTKTLAHLAYSKDDALQWIVGAKAEYSNHGHVPSPYQIVRLAAQPAVAPAAEWTETDTGCARVISRKSAVPAVAPSDSAKPWDQKSALEKAPLLIIELETASERFTRYSNDSIDGLLQAAADCIRALADSAKPAGEALPPIDWERVEAAERGETK